MIVINIRKADKLKLCEMGTKTEHIRKSNGDYKGSALNYEIQMIAFQPNAARILLTQLHAES